MNIQVRHIEFFRNVILLIVVTSLICLITLPSVSEMIERETITYSQFDCDEEPSKKDKKLTSLKKKTTPSTDQYTVPGVGIEFRLYELNVLVQNTSLHIALLQAKQDVYIPPPIA